MFSPPPVSRGGTERQGVNEAAYSGQQRSTTGSQHQIMSDSNTTAASTADQVSSNCHIVFLVCLFFFNNCQPGSERDRRLLVVTCSSQRLKLPEASRQKSLKRNFTECRKRNQVLDTHILSLDPYTVALREGL